MKSLGTLFERTWDESFSMIDAYSKVLGKAGRLKARYSLSWIEKKQVWSDLLSDSNEWTVLAHGEVRPVPHQHIAHNV